MEDFSDDEDEENVDSKPAADAGLNFVDDEQVMEEFSDTDSELDSDDEEGLMGEEDMSGEGATNDGPDL
ncbi:MAG: hypothetical protein M1836_007994 [Candelina mexicana]|nr:MAG: hypothetical protein M1836_007994 [Candelina mexicana]